MLRVSGFAHFNIYVRVFRMYVLGAMFWTMKNMKYFQLPQALMYRRFRPIRKPLWRWMLLGKVSSVIIWNQRVSSRDCIDIPVHIEIISVPSGSHTTQTAKQYNKSLTQLFAKYRIHNYLICFGSIHDLHMQCVFTPAIDLILVNCKTANSWEKLYELLQMACCQSNHCL